ncbi:hypothetical protein XBP1_3010029 [Xenorhabdus bovienii str. puntauvense]|uniref:Uncharacterized protein n=4 Tax=Xenorhabdus bovienii TaxID=40576 RepID=A0A0B6XBF3_XENBV|nr:hypothetical protein XBFFR1_2070059 [Xenorhabdus bovienii str. feltiae France]CDG90949.1 hypothetical protein XBFFL1_1190043 [Xenorhabdus bovienii str. feltiae Florida]CDG98380.1 hypothetical protein XBP1_3010029 [Xenorhabdus bovienii str. puntauvense]CDH00693.1 hypothetical protein XBFM1_1740056 [Xenorhabdus bovienii str. feltiae Moldova]CDH23742.1 hypothetical protein XBKB1_200003 [Xenorhabdus bovienii str. kraussei Becker Underwood]CDM90496.1 protein of unknown function [Xenorhabdus bovi
MMLSDVIEYSHFFGNRQHSGLSTNALR